MDSQSLGFESLCINPGGDTRGTGRVPRQEEETKGGVPPVQAGVSGPGLFKKGIVAVLATLTTFTVYAHPDGATPYWYPSSYIYGFVKGCADTVELRRAPITEKLWPDEVRSVCGCVLDSVRHSLTYQESLEEPIFQLIVNSVMPVCVDEEMSRKKK